MVFRSIASQLAKPNEKFMYGAVREGGRARDFEEAIEWLVSAGMLNRIYNVSKIEHPLSAFDKLDQFKLFDFDTGLLKHMPTLITAPSFKKYITEHQPEHALRFSKRGYRKDGYITNLPLYLARKTKELL